MIFCFINKLICKDVIKIFLSKIIYNFRGKLCYMKLGSKIKLLMITSSADLGGGPKQMFSLGTNLNDSFMVFYALPKNKNYLFYLDSKNYVEISERKINIKDIFNLIRFIQKIIYKLFMHMEKVLEFCRVLSIFFYKKNLFILFMASISNAIVFSLIAFI